jgi:hypothetical protein
MNLPQGVSAAGAGGLLIAGRLNQRIRLVAGWRPA